MCLTYFPEPQPELRGGCSENKKRRMQGTKSEIKSWRKKPNLPPGYRLQPLLQAASTPLRLTLTLALMFTARPSSRSSLRSAPRLSALQLLHSSLLDSRFSGRGSATAVAVAVAVAKTLAQEAVWQVRLPQYARVLCILWLRFFYSAPGGSVHLHFAFDSQTRRICRPCHQAGSKPFVVRRVIC